MLYYDYCTYPWLLYLMAKRVDEISVYLVWEKYGSCTVRPMEN